MNYRKYRFVSMIAVLQLLSVIPSACTPSSVTSKNAVRNIAYAHNSGKPVLMDIYVPKEHKDMLPLIVWIHGGGWKAGSKDNCPAVQFTDLGYVVASINYRLSQEAPFPAQIQDCKAAIRWLRANAAKYYIDPGRIGVWGASAGGHLAALLGTSANEHGWDVGENKKYSSRVQAVCDWFGPTCLWFDNLTINEKTKSTEYAPGDWKVRSGLEVISQLLGGPLLKNKNKALRASPVTYVSSDDAPFLVVHGDEDAVVPLSQSELLYKKLKQAKVPVSLHVVKGAGHGFRGADADWLEKTRIKLVADFFNQYLKPSSQ